MQKDCLSTVRRSSNVKRSLREQCCRENLCNRGYPGTLTTRPTTPTSTAAPTSSHVTTTHPHHSPLAQSPNHTTTPSHQPIDISSIPELQSLVADRIYSFKLCFLSIILICQIVIFREGGGGSKSVRTSGLRIWHSKLELNLYD